MKNLNGQWAKGAGLFETMRVEDNQIFAASRHYERAQVAAGKLGFEIANKDDVINSSRQIIEEESFKVGRLRWQFSDQGEFAISYTQFQDPNTQAKLTLLDPSDSHTTMHKTYPYKNLELLKMANDQGFDDAIIQTKLGEIAETSVTSLLLNFDGGWVTPPLEIGILNGVIRALVLEAGLAKEKNIKSEDLARVSAMVQLSSLRSAQPVGSINGQKLEVDLEICAKIRALHSLHKGK